MSGQASYRDDDPLDEGVSWHPQSSSQPQTYSQASRPPLPPQQHSRPSQSSSSPPLSQAAPTPPPPPQPQPQYQSQYQPQYQQPPPHVPQPWETARMYQDTPSSAKPQLPYKDTENNRLVIAIDFGTTFTGVAFADSKSSTAELKKIIVLTNWGSGMDNHHKIPSVISYSPAPYGEQQWGADISEHAVTMINMKLELETQGSKLEELELILQVLNGTGSLSFTNVKKAGGYPEYTWKSPTEIVTNYLTKIFERVRKETNLDSPGRSRDPVDIVITVPVGWSYRATNATLRALQGAGFNKTEIPLLNRIMLVSEPEAAAIFIARHLKEEKGTEFLRLGECFIICDAGGGTVDVVAYQVKKLDPLELEPISIPTSDKCGATYINEFFKRWLRDLIGEENYQHLDPEAVGQRVNTHTTEGGTMRALISRFEVLKKNYSNQTGTKKLDLPPPLDQLYIENRLSEGELLLHPEDMKEIFYPCVNRVVELIAGQRSQVERKQRRVKNVFLVGGFGESPFLQQELDKSLMIRKIALRRPEHLKSWTAVVQGAVICGIEKARHAKVRLMSPAPSCYGIVVDKASSLYEVDKNDVFTDTISNTKMAKKQFSWLIKAGDLVLSDEKTVADEEFPFIFAPGHPQKFNLPVYEYEYDDDDPPDRWETGQHEVTEVGLVPCNFSSIPRDEIDQRRNPKTGAIYYAAYLICRFKYDLHILEVEVYLNSTRIGHTKITTKSKKPSRDSPSPERDILRPLPPQAETITKKPFYSVSSPTAPQQSSSASRVSSWVDSTDYRSSRQDTPDTQSVVSQLPSMYGDYNKGALSSYEPVSPIFPAAQPAGDPYYDQYRTRQTNPPYPLSVRGSVRKGEETSEAQYGYGGQYRRNGAGAPKGGGFYSKGKDY